MSSSRARVNSFHAKRITNKTTVDLSILTLFFVILGAFFPQRASAFTLPEGWNSTEPVIIVPVITSGGDSALTPTGITTVWTEWGSDGDRNGVFVGHFSFSLQSNVSKFQANNYSQDDQWFPSIVSRGGNGTVVVWKSESQDNSASSVYKLLLDNDAGKEGGETPLSSVQSGEQSTPALAGTCQGWASAWPGTERNMSGFELMVGNFIGSGDLVGTEEQANTYAPSSQAGASLASCLNITLATWESWEDGSEHGVYGRFMDLLTNFLTDPFRISRNTFASQWKSDSACHDHNYLVAYESEIDLPGTASMIKAQGVNINGTNVTLVGPTIDVSDDAADYTYVRVGACGDIFTVTWGTWGASGDKQIFIKLFNKQFQNFTAVLSPETGPGDRYDLNSNTHPDGCLLLWSAASVTEPGLRAMILSYTPPVISTSEPSPEPTPFPTSEPTTSTTTSSTTITSTVMTMMTTFLAATTSTHPNETTPKQLIIPEGDSQIPLILGIGFGGLALFCSSGIMAHLVIASRMKAKHQLSSAPRQSKRHSSTKAVELWGASHYGEFPISDENGNNEYEAVSTPLDNPSPRRSLSSSRHRRRSVSTKRQSQTMELVSNKSDPTSVYSNLPLKSKSSDPNQISSSYITGPTPDNYFDVPPSGQGAAMQETRYAPGPTESVHLERGVLP